MNKSDLINEVFNKTVLPKKDCEMVVNSLFDTILEELIKGSTISISGFGIFETKTLAAKKITNLHTKEMIDVPEKKSVKFKLSKTAKEKMNF